MKGGRFLAPLLLVLLGLLAFSTAWGNGFTDWDDPAYITENRLIRGLSWERIAAAFSGFHLWNYNPLHLVSYMADHALWGLEPRGFLLTSILLHLLAGLLAWTVFRRLSGSPAAAFACAAVFLVHPTRAESVAWLSERKDVLSGVFSLAAVAIHLRRCGAGPGGPSRFPATEAGERRAFRPAGLYAAGLLVFLLALLSKSQVVTLPLVLLALEVHGRRPLRPAILESVPYLVLSAIFSLVTLKAHAGEGSSVLGEESLGGLSLLRPLAALPLYLRSLLWPPALSPLHPEPASVGAWAALALAGLALLAGILWGAWLSLGRRRVVFAATAWSLFLLLPVSGLVPNPVLAADRYLYLAVLGPAWVGGEVLASQLPGARAGLAAGLGALVLAVSCALYAPVWRGPEALWGRVLARDPGSSVARANLGMHLLGRGRSNQARRLFEEDLAQRPCYRESFYGLAEVLRGEGRLDEALAQYEKLLSLSVGDSRAATRYADFLADCGRPEEALRVIARERPRPSFALHQALFRIHLSLGRLEEANGEAERAVDRDPFHEEGWHHLGLAREKLGRLAGAAEAYRRAAEREPGFQPACEALALLELRQGKPARAAESLERARGRPASWWNLAALTRLDLGEREPSLEAARQATRLAPHDARYWANRSTIELRWGLHEDAARSLEEALKRDPRLEERLDSDLRALLTGSR